MCVQYDLNLHHVSVQTKCFICGIGSDYFDTTPHGFETHTLDEHNLANYMCVTLLFQVCACAVCANEQMNITMCISSGSS